MGLFDKKFCDFCGNKIGLLGNKKLEDANMCKDCASKLSPWFSERRHSTKADIDQQLAYREQNKSAVAAFHATRTLGNTSTKLLIDDNARKFMVTSAKDIAAANPDVLDFSQAQGCDLDVKEHRSEIRRTDSSGKSVSYNPPRYKYSYEFHAIIRVNHPYFDEMKFALSNGYIEVGEQPMNPGQSGGWSVSRSGFNLLGNKIDEYYKCVDCGNEIKAAIDGMRGAAAADPMAQQDARLAALKAEASQLRAKMDAQVAQQGCADPTDQARHMQVQMEIANIMAARQQGAGGMAFFGANMALQGLQQPMPAGGPRRPEDGGAIPMQQAMAQGGYQQPMQQQAMAQGGYQQPMQQQAMAQAPAAGGTMVCPFCQATTAIGAAGICTFCGSKIV
ncbi:MAG: DUF4428 domain-containing protein [Clostridiales bacterium]|nr:DUF4428 domain-containing protein [Clostridiales bacterium]